MYISKIFLNKLLKYYFLCCQLHFSIQTRGILVNVGLKGWNIQRLQYIEYCYHAIFYFVTNIFAREIIKIISK